MKLLLKAIIGSTLTGIATAAGLYVFNMNAKKKCQSDPKFDHSSLNEYSLMAKGEEAYRVKNAKEVSNETIH